MENKEIRVLIGSCNIDYLIDVVNDLNYLGFTVLKVNDGSSLISEAKKFEPHIILFEVSSPELDGIDLCHRLNADPFFKTTSIVFTTILTDNYVKVACLDANADDVIVLPITTLVLEKKIHSLLRLNRRLNPVTNKKLIKFYIDKENYTVIKNGKKIDLPKKEFELLLLLSSNPGRVFTKNEIYRKMWGNNQIVVSDRTIPVYIKKIRNRIGDEYIINSKGVGYSFTYGEN